MKTAYLIYYPWEAEKNKGFIRMFQERGKAVGIAFRYIPIDSYQTAVLPDLVLNRTRSPKISRWYEERQIPVYHPSELVEIANDKYKTLCYIGQNLPQSLQNWCPVSQRIEAREQEKLTRPDPEQWVIKSLQGHGGSEVFLLSDARWRERLAGQTLLLQRRIPSKSQDLRIYLLGGTVYQAVLRTGTKDFRSNYSLGGSVEAYSLSESQWQRVQLILKALPEKWKGMLGMDFILTEQGELVFNELEEMVGCRMLYQCTAKDIVKDYVKLLVQGLS